MLFGELSLQIALVKQIWEVKKNDCFDDIWNDVRYGFGDTWEMRKNE